MIERKKCPQPIGYFVKRGDKEKKVKHPANCNCWSCSVCGPRKQRKFLFCLNQASKAMINEGFRFRGLTLTLGPNAKNQDLGRYWHRFVMSLKKAGYNFQYLWVKEFQKNGKLHMHVLITSFIPWNVIKYYWCLATNGTSSIVWIAEAQVKYTAAYMSKYITKSLVDAPFRKGERRYGMSQGVREEWPIRSKLEKSEESAYEFFYKPDNTNLLENARDELTKRINRRGEWRSEISNDKKRKHKHIHGKRRQFKPKHNK
ncbi:MAG: hypothetical protein WBZ29_13620 [Methanocella sp.]